MSSLPKSAAALCIAALSSGCGGGSDDAVSFRDALSERADLSVALVDRYSAATPTGTARMPTTGSADFSGVAAILVDPVAATIGDDLILLGDARLVARFAGAGTVTGTIDNIAGARGTALLGADTFEVPGTIAIGAASSGIGENAGMPSNEWRASYGGQLTTPDGQLELVGTLEGIFLGNRVGNPTTDLPMRAIQGLDDGLAMLNGREVGVVVEVIAEN